MAEETGKASENKTTTEDVTGQSETTHGHRRRIFISFAAHDLPSYETWVADMMNPERDIFFCAPLPPHLFNAWKFHTAANTAELALAASSPMEGEASDEEAQRREAVDEAVAKVLINSSIAEVERAREAMLRDDEEIERLKQETRAILTKLAA